MLAILLTISIVLLLVVYSLPLTDAHLTITIFLTLVVALCAAGALLLAISE